jgi:CHAT domain-containing protein
MKKILFLSIFAHLANITFPQAGDITFIDEDVALIKYIADEEGVLGTFVYRSDFVKYYRIPDRDKQIYRLTDRLLDSILRMKEVKSIASDLYGLLIKPFEEAIEDVDRLVIIPSGQLFKLPFSALVDPKSDTYLIEKYALSYLNNVDFLTRKSIFDNRHINAFLFGDAIYERQNENSKRGIGTRGVSPLNEKDYYDQKRIHWTNIPGTGQEVRQLISVLGKYKQYKTVRSFTGAVASETKLKEVLQNLNRRVSNVIHLACHGYYDSYCPAKSSIVLAQNDKSNDGYFSITDIVTYDLKNTVFVLSACETAKGKIIFGEGIFSVTKFLLMSGANSVIATLIVIDDEATVEFMAGFYRHLAVEKEVVHALRNAQLDFINQRERDHPFFWSSFVLFGP